MKTKEVKKENVTEESNEDRVKKLEAKLERLEKNETKFGKVFIRWLILVIPLVNLYGMWKLAKMWSEKGQ